MLLFLRSSPASKQLVSMSVSASLSAWCWLNLTCPSPLADLLSSHIPVSTSTLTSVFSARGEETSSLSLGEPPVRLSEAGSWVSRAESVSCHEEPESWSRSAVSVHCEETVWVERLRSETVPTPASLLLVEVVVVKQTLLFSVLL